MNIVSLNFCHVLKQYALLVSWSFKKKAIIKRFKCVVCAKVHYIPDNVLNEMAIKIISTEPMEISFAINAFKQLMLILQLYIKFYWYQMIYLLHVQKIR